MVNLIDIKQVARVVKDENGQPVVQVPLDVWEAFVGKEEEKKPSQLQQILNLVQKWENEPEDDMPDEWWDEFQQFLQDNRVNFPDRHLDFGDE
jgi:hypothetical protein